MAVFSKYDSEQHLTFGQFGTLQTVIATGVSYGCNFEETFGVAVIGNMTLG